jgi:hypothetical protein
MGSSAQLDSRFFSECQAFNKLGHGVNDTAWNGSEAASIRLGTRHSSDPEAAKRGRSIERLLCEVANSGDLNFRYFADDVIHDYASQPSRPAVIAFYPLPYARAGCEDPIGQVDFGKHGQFDCEIEKLSIEKLLKRIRPRMAKTGRPLEFPEFMEVCRAYWRANKETPKPRVVLRWISEHGELSNEKWPAAVSTQHRYIDNARKEVHG